MIWKTAQVICCACDSRGSANATEAEDRSALDVVTHRETIHELGVDAWRRDARDGGEKNVIDVGGRHARLRERRQHRFFAKLDSAFDPFVVSLGERVEASRFFHRKSK